MVYGSIFHTTVINFYRNMVQFGHRRGVKSYMTGLMTGALALTYVSKVGAQETLESRNASSDFHRENFSIKYDNPVYALPAYENGTHSHEPRGLERKFGGGHH